jgi:hypothetical protein
MASHYLFLTASLPAKAAIWATPNGWLVLCAAFLNMRFAGTLWGKGGPPAAVQADAQAVAQAATFFAV